jgi:hypothetical protein
VSLNGFLPSKKAKSTRVCSLVAGCPRTRSLCQRRGLCSTAARRCPDSSDVDE